MRTDSPLFLICFQNTGRSNILTSIYNGVEFSGGHNENVYLETTCTPQVAPRTVRNKEAKDNPGMRQLQEAQDQGMFQLLALVVSLTISQFLLQCITTEQPPTNPCARCTKQNLICEYVAAGERDDSSADRTDSGESPTNVGFPSRPTIGNPPITPPSFSAGPTTAVPPSRPGSAQFSSMGSSHLIPGSNRQSMYAASSRAVNDQYPPPSLAGYTQTSQAPPHYYASAHDITRPSSRPSIPSPSFYDVQAAHARQYLADSQTHPSQYQTNMGVQPPADGYGMDYSQFMVPDEFIPAYAYDWRQGSESW